jgi:hypothetical protein
LFIARFLDKAQESFANFHDTNAFSLRNAMPIAETLDFMALASSKSSAEPIAFVWNPPFPSD